MQYIEAVHTEKAKYKSVFLAGGITNCPNWQKEVADALQSLDVSVFNPRRADFPIGDNTESEAQIVWEFERLREADVLIFWFSAATLCPITLFEYGAALERKQKIVLGIHPDYKRKIDIEVQTSLMRKEIKISYSVQDMITELLEIF